MAGSDDTALETVVTVGPPSKKRPIAEPQLDEDEVDEFMISTSEVSLPRPDPPPATAAAPIAPPRARKGTGTSRSCGGSSRSSSKGGGSRAVGGRGCGSSSAPDGSVLVGTELLKNFPGHGEFKGRVVEYVPASRSGAGAVDVWSVLYADGDSEDMELVEIRYLVAYECREASRPRRPRSREGPRRAG